MNARLPLAAGAAAAVIWCAAVVLSAGQSPPPGAAWLVHPLDGQGRPRQSRPDLLDTPVLPGSIVKAAALVAALEAGVVTARSAQLCRRVVTVDGHTYTCAHPVLNRALTPAEALAYSCNDFFLALAPRLPRAAINTVRTRAGLPVLPASAPLAASLVGLDGPRVAPRVLLDAVARLAGVGPLLPVPMRDETRRVLWDGLRGASEYGTASTLGERGLAALAKTGTASMPGGGSMGLVVALEPAEAPTRGVVVMAPGAAGLDAASIAADLLSQPANLLSPSANLLSPRRGRSSDRPDPSDRPATLRVGRSLPGGAVRVDALSLDDYVAQVVAGEARPDARDAALEALAITVRTYALANPARHASEGFDVCDTTHCQVLRPATARTRQAAAITAGRALLSRGRAAQVFHSAWCGGHPERASEVWPGAPEYGPPPSADDACAGEPAWASDLSASDLERAFTAAGLRGGPLRDLRVIARNRTGRVIRIRLEGWSPAEVSGQEFRTLVGRHLGWQHVKSTRFELRRTASGYRVSGRGFGHGAGLCVLGAGARAARGESADAILSFYYPGLTVGALPGAPPRDDVGLALPAEESSERAAVLALLQRSRDEIARAAGVAPRPMRVTVHPTVENFGRVTGQPWYVAGATHGTEIDLLPIAVLRRGGRLERVVRHEVAHVLVDPLLEGRPLWVREGVAAHFAARGPDGEGGLQAALTCPSDSELRRPSSPAAQRQAYARAHACVVRQIEAGVSWRDVR